MRLSVPLEKDINFSQELFHLVSDHVSDLAIENEKLPNRIIFTGQIGHEILDFIKEKQWNFKGFELISAPGILNEIVFKYDAPLTQVDDNQGIVFEEGSLHGKEINGIPGPETFQKILSAYSSTSFKIERTVRPEKRIQLVRS